MFHSTAHNLESTADLRGTSPLVFSWALPLDSSRALSHEQKFILLNSEYITQSKQYHAKSTVSSRNDQQPYSRRRDFSPDEWGKFHFFTLTLASILTWPVFFILHDFKWKYPKIAPFVRKKSASLRRLLYKPGIRIAPSFCKMRSYLITFKRALHCNLYRRTSLKFILFSEPINTLKTFCLRSNMGRNCRC